MNDGHFLTKRIYVTLEIKKMNLSNENASILTRKIFIICWLRPQTIKTLLCPTPRTSISEMSDNVNNKCSDEADQVGVSSAKLNVKHFAATGGGRREG